LTHACPACGRITSHRFLYSKNGCDIVQCRDCGLGRAVATNFNPTTYYTSDYFSGGRADGYADYLQSEPVLRREFARIVADLRRYIAGGSLLEIGCAYGFFLQEARRYFDVSGIEIAADAAAHARQSGLRVATGVADEATLDQFGSLDAIVMLDVLEHLPQPLDTLNLCARRLNPGGVMLLTTGDFGSPFARLAGSRWRLMTPPQHLWFFTPESIRRLAAGLGLRVEEISHPWKIVPLSLIMFQLRRLFALPPQKPTQLGSVGVPVNLFDAMRVVLRKSPP
jgi:SAM-dependent methyltransferase